MSDNTKYENYNWKKNQSGLIIVFSPIILLSIIFLAIDYIWFQNEFSDEIIYFSNLYINRLVVFLMIFLFWNFLKGIMSGYLLLVITYVFNMLLVISDNVNINEMKNDERNFQTSSNFYRLLKLKELCNYMFLIGWFIILSMNLKSWYALFMTRDSVIEELEQSGIKTD